MFGILKEKFRGFKEKVEFIIKNKATETIQESVKSKSIDSKTHDTIEKKVKEVKKPRKVGFFEKIKSTCINKRIYS